MHFDDCIANINATHLSCVKYVYIEYLMVGNMYPKNYSLYIQSMAHKQESSEVEYIAQD